MFPNWSIKNEIAKRANRESDYEWAQKKERTPFPPFKKPKREPLSAGVYNLVRNLLP